MPLLSSPAVGVPLVMSLIPNKFTKYLTLHKRLQERMIGRSLDITPIHWYPLEMGIRNQWWSLSNVNL